jgi:hypothetical protein
MGCSDSRPINAGMTEAFNGNSSVLKKNAKKEAFKPQKTSLRTPATKGRSVISLARLAPNIQHFRRKKKPEKNLRQGIAKAMKKTLNKLERLEGMIAKIENIDSIQKKKKSRFKLRNSKSRDIKRSRSVAETSKITKNQDVRIKEHLKKFSRKMEKKFKNNTSERIRRLVLPDKIPEVNIELEESQRKKPALKKVVKKQKRVFSNSMIEPGKERSKKIKILDKKTLTSFDTLQEPQSKLKSSYMLSNTFFSKKSPKNRSLTISNISCLTPNYKYSQAEMFHKNSLQLSSNSNHTQNFGKKRPRIRSLAKGFDEHVEESNALLGKESSKKSKKESQKTAKLTKYLNKIHGIQGTGCRKIELKKRINLSMGKMDSKKLFKKSRKSKVIILGRYEKVRGAKIINSMNRLDFKKQKLAKKHKKCYQNFLNLSENTERFNKDLTFSIDASPIPQKPGCRLGFDMVMNKRFGNSKFSSEDDEVL